MEKSGGHYPVLNAKGNIEARRNEEIALEVNLENNYNREYKTNWFYYVEAGNIPHSILNEIKVENDLRCIINAPNMKGQRHIIFEIIINDIRVIHRYKRFIMNVD